MVETCSLCKSSQNLNLEDVSFLKFYSYLNSFLFNPFFSQFDLESFNLYNMWCCD